jgi:hypothetical protein
MHCEQKVKRYRAGEFPRQLFYSRLLSQQTDVPQSHEVLSLAWKRPSYGRLPPTTVHDETLELIVRVYYSHAVLCAGRCGFRFYRSEPAFGISF